MQTPKHLQQLSANVAHSFHDRILFLRHHSSSLLNIAFRYQGTAYTYRSGFQAHLCFPLSLNQAEQNSSAVRLQQRRNNTSSVSCAKHMLMDENMDEEAQESGRQHGRTPSLISQMMDEEARLRVENNRLKEENARLVAQVKSIEEERARAVTQAYALRHDVTRLRSELSTRTLLGEQARGKTPRLTEATERRHRQEAYQSAVETQQEQDGHDEAARWGVELQQFEEQLRQSQALLETEKRRAAHEKAKLVTEQRKKMGEAGHLWLTKESQLSKQIRDLEDQVRALSMQVARMEDVEHRALRQRLQEQQLTPMLSVDNQVSDVPAKPAEPTFTQVKESQQTKTEIARATSPLGDNGLHVKSEGLIASLRNNMVGRFGARPASKLVKTRSEGSIPADTSLMSGGIRAASHRQRKPAFEARVELEGDSGLSELP